MSRAYIVTALLVIGAIVSFFYMNYRISELEFLINRRTTEIENLIEIKPTVEKIERELFEIHRNLRALRLLIERTAERTEDLEEEVNP